MNDVIPLIDLETLVNRDSHGTEELVKAVTQALETVGFFHISGHGVPPELVQRLRDEAYQFFKLPLEEKMKVKRPLPEITRGYDPPAQQSLSSTKDGASPPDLQEGFGMGGFNYRSEDPYYTEGLGHYFYAPNLWPERPSGFRSTLEEYHSSLTVLANRLMHLFAVALEINPDYFDDKINKTGAHMRLNKYPPQDTEPVPGQLRSGAHTDYGTLTILYGEDTPGGLQVMGSDGNWFDVHPKPGTFVVNIGDCMERWTNNRWKSTLHRVVNPPRSEAQSERLSVAYFHSTNYDAEIKCLETCQSKSNPPRYEPIHYASYYIEKLMQSRQTLNG